MISEYNENNDDKIDGKTLQFLLKHSIKIQRALNAKSGNSVLF